MDLVTLLVVIIVGCIVVGGAYWIITHYFADPFPRRYVLWAVGAIFLVLLLVWFAGFLGHPIGSLRI